MLKVGFLIRILLITYHNGSPIIYPSLSSYNDNYNDFLEGGENSIDELSYNPSNSENLKEFLKGCYDQPDICGPRQTCLRADELGGVCGDLMPEGDSDENADKDYDDLWQRSARAINYDIYNENARIPLELDETQPNWDYQDELEVKPNVVKRGHQRYSDTDYPQGADEGVRLIATLQNDESQEPDFEPIQLFYENPPGENEEQSANSEDTPPLPPALGKRDIINELSPGDDDDIEGLHFPALNDYFYHDKKDDNDPFPKRYDEPKKGTTLTADYPYVDDNANRLHNIPPRLGGHYYDQSQNMDSMIPLSYTLSRTLKNFNSKGVVVKPSSNEKLSNPNDKYAFVLSDYAFIRTKQNITDQSIGYKMLSELAKQLKVPLTTFSNIKINGKDIIFKVNPNLKALNASLVAYYSHHFKQQLENAAGGIKIASAGIGSEVKVITTKERRGDLVPDPAALYEDDQTVVLSRAIEPKDSRGRFLALAACLALMMLILTLLLIYVARGNTLLANKLGGSKKRVSTTSQHALFSPTSQNGVKNESGEGYYPPKTTSWIFGKLLRSKKASSAVSAETQKSPPLVQVHNSNESSNRSSTSSWSEDKVLTKMDVTTGHVVLSYMEKHILNRDLIDQEWASCDIYVPSPLENVEGVTAEPATQSAYLADFYLEQGIFPDQGTLKKLNPYSVLPYPFNRVKLKSGRKEPSGQGGSPTNEASAAAGDYINASFVTEHDPRYPSYIATQNPLKETISHFWKMVWDNGICIIVNLTRPEEIGKNEVAKYWPDQGVEVYSVYEVHLVSEHMWCEDYIVRSFYLKNLQSNETRTLTQFHYLAWPDQSLPRSTKSLLDFRRKVNKSYKGRSTPVIVHCNDGSGRTGVYMLVDMILCRLTKGVKEIDIAASVEHLRDQRMKTVSTKAQFEFAFLAVSEEVQIILKAIAGSTTPSPVVTKHM